MAGGVFVSWTRADGDDRPEQLAALLTDRFEIDAFVDSAEIGAFDPIDARILSGLARSSVVVAWYSRAYPSRRACREELTIALLAAQRAGQLAARVLVVNPEPD